MAVSFFSWTWLFVFGFSRIFRKHVLNCSYFFQSSFKAFRPNDIRVSGQNIVPSRAKVLSNFQPIPREREFIVGCAKKKTFPLEQISPIIRECEETWLKTTQTISVNYSIFLRFVIFFNRSIFFSLLSWEISHSAKTKNVHVATQKAVTVGKRSTRDPCHGCEVQSPAAHSHANRTPLVFDEWEVKNIAERWEEKRKKQKTFSQMYFIFHFRVVT